MASEYKIIHPVKYYRDFLAHEVRPDGRGLMKFRSVAINVKSITTADGSALVKIGNSTVCCGVKAELATPKPEEPNLGYVIPNVDLTPLCSSKFKPGPPGDQAQVSSQFLADVLSNSGCIDNKELCIAPDKLAWVLYCDIMCLDYDGSILDASVMALVAALKSVTLPRVEYDAEKETIEVNDEERKPLNVHNMPVSTTFAIFDDEILIADPTHDEENLSTGIVTIVVKGEKLCSVHKPGGSPLSEEQLQDCISRAKNRARLVCETVEKALQNPD